MGHDLLPRDDRLVQERGHSFTLEEAVEQHSAPLDDGRHPPHFGSDRAIPGMVRSSSASDAGRWLSTGLGISSPRMINPSMRLRVVPTRSRSPFDKQKRPRIPRIGIDSPIKANSVRSGRVNKFRQANVPMTDPLGVQVITNRRSHEVRRTSRGNYSPVFSIQEDRPPPTAPSPPIPSSRPPIPYESASFAHLASSYLFIHDILLSLFDRKLW